MKTVIFFVGLQIVCALGMYALKDECPEVEVDPSLNATDCGFCLDCAFGIGSMCCPNECGTHSCAFVRNPCVIDGMTYNHHDFIPRPWNMDTDDCGDCWCQNGKKECNLYSCKGPVP